MKTEAAPRAGRHRVISAIKTRETTGWTKLPQPWTWAEWRRFIYLCIMRKMSEIRWTFCWTLRRAIFSRRLIWTGLAGRTLLSPCRIFPRKRTQLRRARGKRFRAFSSTTSDGVRHLPHTLRCILIPYGLSQSRRLIQLKLPTHRAWRKKTTHSVPTAILKDFMHLPQGGAVTNAMWFLTRASIICRRRNICISGYIRRKRRVRKLKSDLKTLPIQNIWRLSSALTGQAGSLWRWARLNLRATAIYQGLIRSA